MSKATPSPTTKPEAYKAFREGNLSKERAREILGDEWEKALQLGRVEDILDEQPDPEVRDEELFR